MTKQRTGIIGSRVPADVGEVPAVQPVVQPPRDTILAAFTPRELDTLRSICRDSDNELGMQFLKAALARAGAK